MACNHCKEDEPKLDIKMFVINGFLYLRINDKTTKVQLPTGTGGGGYSSVESLPVTIASNGQTLLINVIPAGKEVVAFSINGILYWPSENVYEIVENNIVWTGGPATTLETTDTVVLLVQAAEQVN